ncbi:MAG: RluA family pseudouridine synthase, partial [Myxococcales bacterium]|nr:RluA family pseudouridine synthase [Myxococcales bacterium]
MYDSALHHIPDDPPVLTWTWITDRALDLRRPPPQTGLDAAAWDAVRHHGGLWVNGHPAAERCDAGSRIQVYAFGASPPALSQVPLKILLDRDGVVAVDKPSGLSTQRTRASAHRCLQAMLIDRLGDPGLRAVHRLDRATSGVVLFARTKAATQALHAQFRGRTVQKRYLAVVAPPPAEDAFEVDAPLARAPTPQDAPAHLVMAVSDAPDAQPSHTRFEVAGRRDDRAVVRALPVTGRTHQI